MTSALSDPASEHRNGRHTVAGYSFPTDWALNESVDPLEDIVTKLLIELGVDPSGRHFEQTPARMASQAPRIPRLWPALEAPNGPA